MKSVNIQYNKDTNTIVITQKPLKGKKTKKKEENSGESSEGESVQSTPVQSVQSTPIQNTLEAKTPRDEPKKSSPIQNPIESNVDQEVKDKKEVKNTNILTPSANSKNQLDLSVDDGLKKGSIQAGNGKRVMITRNEINGKREIGSSIKSFLDDQHKMTRFSFRNNNLSQRLRDRENVGEKFKYLRQNNLI